MRWKLRPLAGWGICMALSMAAHAQAATCPRDAAQAGALMALKTDDATLADTAARARAEDVLFACLSSPDPALRDGLAFTVLSRWMREKRFSADQLRARWNQLDRQLAAPDPQGVARPFAALVFSEIARTDRIDPWMSPSERERMAASAAAYLRAVDDYRGLVAGTGWHHGVAHAADWAMQLVLNPQVDAAQVRELLAAVQAQVVPQAGHAYVFGEQERLLRPVYYALRRGVPSDDEWERWLKGLVARVGSMPATGPDAGWLARRHDLLTFLNALYVEIDNGGEAVSRYQPAVRRALQGLSG